MRSSTKIDTIQYVYVLFIVVVAVASIGITINDFIQSLLK